MLIKQVIFVVWLFGVIMGLTLMLNNPQKAAAQPTLQCIAYGVNDASGADTQLFTIDMQHTVVPVGSPLNDRDIEAIDIHPQTGELYAIAGNNGSHDGDVYVLNKTNAQFTLIGNTGFISDEVVSASFHPDGTLWAFIEDNGLVTINLSTGQATFVWLVTGSGVGDNWEGLSWDIEGTFLYGSHGSKLYQWNPVNQVATLLCGTSFLPSPTESLEMRTDNVLIGGHHNETNPLMALFEIDFVGCNITAANYDLGTMNDIESLAYDSCFEDSCANNTPPVAIIDPADADIELGESQLFNGSNSTDLDNDLLSYAWTIDGQTITSNNATLNYTPLLEGVSTIRLVVADACASHETTALLTTRNPPDVCAGNTAPVAHIDPINSTLTLGDIAQFDASASTDEDGDTLTYVWAVDGTSLSSGGSMFEYTPSNTGEYTIRLVVSDDCGSHEITTELTAVQPTGACEVNTPPVANIDPTQKTVTLGETFLLDASGSIDADGDSLTYQWVVPGTVTVQTSTTTSYSPETLGESLVQLTVSDQCSSHATTSVITTIEPVDACDGNSPPQMVITPENSEILLGEQITFSSELSTDDEGDTLLMGWELSNTPNTFNATSIIVTPTSTGAYIVTLTGADECGEGSTQTSFTVVDPPGEVGCSGSGCNVCASNQSPQANAGADIHVVLGEEFLLSGLGSSDPEDDVLDYEWTIANTQFNSATATAVTTIEQPGTFIAVLQVQDSCGFSVDELTITVEDNSVSNECALNNAPIARAGDDIKISLGEKIILDGSNSSDPDGDTLLHIWNIPSMSLIRISEVTEVTIDQVGTHTVTLGVNDACSSHSDSLSVEVTPPPAIMAVGSSTFTPPKQSPRAGLNPLQLSIRIGLGAGAFVAVMLGIYLFRRRAQKGMTNLLKNNHE